MTTAARLIQAPIALIASPQAMAPSHHGHIIISNQPTMHYYDQHSHPQLAPSYFTEAPVDPLGIAPKTVTLIAD